MADTELTYEQKYQVPVEATLAEFSVEYAACGSHEILIKAVTSLENVQSLVDALIKVPGVKLP